MRGADSFEKQDERGQGWIAWMKQIELELKEAVEMMSDLFQAQSGFLCDIVGFQPPFV